MSLKITPPGTGWAADGKLGHPPAEPAMLSRWTDQDQDPERWPTLMQRGDPEKGPSSALFPQSLRVRGTVVSVLLTKTRLCAVGAGPSDGPDWRRTVRLVLFHNGVIVCAFSHWGTWLVAAMCFGSLNLNITSSF